MTRLLAELPAARSARWPLDGGELCLHRGVLHHKSNPGDVPADVPRETSLIVRRAGTFALPGWGGRLVVRRVATNGVPLACLAHLELKLREGAEQFQAGIGRPPRSLKKQFQSAGVSVWERSGPLFVSGARLVFVPGLGLDARVIGVPGQALVALQWLSGDAGD